MVDSDLHITGQTYASIRDALPIGDAPAKKRPASAAGSRALGKKADELAEAIHSKFMKLLSDKVTENEGQLSAKDLEDLSDEFRQNMGNIKTVFEQAVESFTRAQQKSREDSERGNMFTRMMVHKFEHRFIEDRNLRQNPDGLSRRILPGFMNALYTMVGTQKQQDFEQKAQAIIKQARIAGDGEVDWDDVHQTSGARIITLGAEIEMAQHFRESDKRIDWMVAMVNSNLIPLDEGMPGASWEFSREAAYKMLVDIFADLRIALRDNRTRTKIRDKLGHDMIVLLDDVATQFK
jgi:hypothetical protein